MAKKGMSRPDPKEPKGKAKNVIIVPEIEGKAKSGKEKAGKM